MSLRPAIALVFTAILFAAASTHAQTAAPVRPQPACQVSWETDARPLNVNDPVDRVHLREDLARVGLIALRWANQRPPALRPKVVEQCTDHFIQSIAAGHHVTVAAVKALRDDLPIQTGRRP